MANEKTSIRVLSLCVTLFLLLFSFILPFKLLFSFDVLYKYDIYNLKLDKQLQLSADELLVNYKILIGYLKNSHETKLTIPGFPMSEHGLIHFEEVKRLFLMLNPVFLASAVLILGGILLLWRVNGRFIFLKWTGNGLLLLPILLVIPVLFFFEDTFIVFHRLVFNNSYWVFDPLTDPIINALPEAFFFHCGVVYLAMILVIAMLYHLVYFVLTKKYKGGL